MKTGIFFIVAVMATSLVGIAQGTVLTLDWHRIPENLVHSLMGLVGRGADATMVADPGQQPSRKSMTTLAIAS